MKKRIAGILMLMLGATPLSALALDMSQVKINGFLSQGYIESNHNNFLTKDTTDGTTEFNEVGLTVTAQVNDKLRLGVQMLSRDLGPEGNNDLRLDWAIADYRLHDSLGVRIGKVKLPIGLYNEGRDSDFLRNTVFLPQSIYDETKRPMLGAVQGGGLYGNLPVGPVGDFDYQFVYGETNFPTDSTILTNLQMGATKVAKGAGVFGPLPVPAALVTKVDTDNDYVYAASLTYNTPINGLRLGGCFYEGKTTLTLYTNQVTVASGGPPPAPVTPSVPVIGEGEVGMKDAYVLSLDYTSKYFDLAGEYSEYKNIKEFFGKTVKTGTSQGYYGLLTVHATSQLHLFTMYDVFYADKDDKHGKAYADNPLVTGIQSQDFMGWRKDLAVGVRYDLNPNWLVKVEWHDVNGVGPNALAYNTGADLSEDWNYLVVKTSFNF